VTVRPFTLLERQESHRADLCEILYWDLCTDMSTFSSFWLKFSNNNHRHLTWRHTCIYQHGVYDGTQEICGTQRKKFASIVHPLLRHGGIWQCVLCKVLKGTSRYAPQGLRPADISELVVLVTESRVRDLSSTCCTSVDQQRMVIGGTEASSTSNIARTNLRLNPTADRTGWLRHRACQMDAAGCTRAKHYMRWSCNRIREVSRGVSVGQGMAPWRQ
jgi:hypothetical protein